MVTPQELTTRLKHLSTQNNQNLSVNAARMKNIMAIELFFEVCVICFSYAEKSGPKGYKTFSCSSQLSINFILLINVKIPTNVGILTFISMMNTSECLKQEIMRMRSLYKGTSLFYCIMWRVCLI